MRIVVHGCGMTALVTAVSLAAAGRKVELRCGEMTAGGEACVDGLSFEEPGLSEALAAQVQAGRLHVGELPENPAPGRPAVHFLAVAQEDTQLAARVIDAIAGCEQDLLLVNQVNFGVGVTDVLLARLQKRRAGTDWRTAVAAFPDFLRRGTALQNFRHPDRLVLGVDDPWAEGVLREVLCPKGQSATVLVMPPRDAEFTKQAVSGMLATRLSFMNDMAKVADELGIDIENVRQGIGSDDRIGGQFLNPGCGFGGTGFFNDLLSLQETLAKASVRSGLVDTAMRVNEEQKDLLFRKLWKHFRGDLAGRTVAIWGASFKPDTDRVDHAPSLVVIDALLAQDVKVRVHDPMALGQLQDRFPGESRLVACDDPYDAAAGADALMLLTEWQVYSGADYDRLRQVMSQAVLLDGRNLFDPQQWRAAGFTYYGVGRR